MADEGVCLACGRPLSGGSCPSCTSVPAARVIRREIVLLVILAIAAVPTYLLTRKLADLNRARNGRIAAYWYQQGQRQLREGKPEEAIASLREATTNDHDNRGFAFTLAQALSATNRDDEARLALLRLRESTPENPQINLQLARLSARHHGLSEAVRYYHHALYGLWTGDKVDDQRREVRLELIRLLLDHKDRGKALAELLVLSSDAPRTTDAQLQLGQLFLEAGDTSNALHHFVLSSELDGRNAAALAGAGEAAFRRGNYTAAQSYLRRAVARNRSDAKAAGLLEIARLIQSSDPLAPHLPRSEQVRRLTAALEQVVIRVQQCPAMAADPLRSQAETMLPGITPGNLREDPELLATGAELVFQLEEKASQTCGPPAGLDQALLLAGRKHGANER